MFTSTTVTYRQQEEEKKEEEFLNSNKKAKGENEKQQHEFKEIEDSGTTISTDPQLETDMDVYKEGEKILPMVLVMQQLQDLKIYG